MKHKLPEQVWLDDMNGSPQLGESFELQEWQVIAWDEVMNVPSITIISSTDIIFSMFSTHHTYTVYVAQIRTLSL